MFNLQLAKFWSKAVDDFTTTDAYALGYLFNFKYLEEVEFGTLQLVSSSRFVLQEVVRTLFSAQAMASITSYGGDSENLVWCDFFVDNLFIQNREKKLNELLAIAKFDDELFRAFLRGVFDVNGSISLQNSGIEGQPTAQLLLDTRCREFIKKLFKLGFPYKMIGEYIVWVGADVLDFTSWLYKDASLIPTHKKEELINLNSYIPILKGIPENLHFKYGLSQENAVAPFKINASDSGYFVTITGIKHWNENIYSCNTGLHVSTPFGWYFDLVPTPELTNMGYMLVNSPIVINQTNSNEITFCVMKIDPSVPDLTPGVIVGQLIPRPIIHLGWKQYEEALVEESDGQETTN